MKLLYPLNILKSLICLPLFVVIASTSSIFAVEIEPVLDEIYASRSTDGEPLDPVVTLIEVIPETDLGNLTLAERTGPIERAQKLLEIEMGALRGFKIRQKMTYLPWVVAEIDGA